MDEVSIDDLFSCMDDVDESEEVCTETQSNNDSAKQVSKREHEDKGAVDSPAKRFKSDEEVNVDGIKFEEFRNRIVVHNIQALESCTHEVACPPGQDYEPLTPRVAEPAKQYPFALDPFQKESILCIDNNQSVLVSAHTSAGKTVVAEYAVALSLKNKQRVIYTTPIKALSNQKYREFYDEFKDVGLITGDVTINPSASCLIMTTEILRNMLYRGSEIMREVGWVVFDEIHYMRDKERGVVWEETIILLPRNAHFVFLSATIPNARQFAEWVAHLHQQPCHVVYTDYRPTPLQHFIFPAGGQGIHMVVDLNGTFKEDNYNTAMSVLQNAGEAAKGDQKGRKGGVAGKDPQQTDIFKVVKMIMDREFAPVIVFSFSKKSCEIYAKHMTKLDFNSQEEKDLVNEVFTNATNVLSEEDRNLQQVKNILPLLQRGIGIHHGGLLPILKETIEILFGEGLLKVLFATETFAMGLNMPARTVLFTGMRKFDGKNYRFITPGEYVQMSGRAGRRGIDSKGIVILMVDEKMPTAAGRDIIKGLPDPINSSFHLTYNMVLNLLRIEDINPEYLLERSFFQFQNQASIPDLYEKYQQKLLEYKKITVENEGEIASYYDLRQLLDSFVLKFRNYITQPKYLVPFLQNGRLVKIKVENDEYDWGMIVTFKKVNKAGPKGRPSPIDSSSKVNVDILLRILPSSVDGNNPEVGAIPKPCPADKEGEIEVVTVCSSMITHLSSIRISAPYDLRPVENRKLAYRTLQKVKNQFNNNPLLLKPKEDMKINDPDFDDIVQKIENLEKRLENHSMKDNPQLESIYTDYEKKKTSENELDVATKKLTDAKSVLQLDELKRRKRVLRRLGYCTNTDVIQLKGRVGCELSCSDEILLTELLLNGVFNPLNSAQCCALLSCFICDEKSNSSFTVSDELSGPLRQMQDLARKIAKVSTESKLPLDEDSYVEQFRPCLMEVVYAWCNGASFSKLCDMTDIFEGSIIRCMRRLEELLREMVQASKTMGNGMEEKFNDCIRIIKRDIVFAASLYL